MERLSFAADAAFRPAEPALENVTIAPLTQRLSDCSPTLIIEGEGLRPRG